MAVLWVTRTLDTDHHPVAQAFDAARLAFLLHIAGETGLNVDAMEVQIDDGLTYYGIPGSLEQISAVLKVAYNWGIANLALDLADGEDLGEAKKLIEEIGPLVDIIE